MRVMELVDHVIEYRGIFLKSEQQRFKNSNFDDFLFLTVIICY